MRQAFEELFSTIETKAGENDKVVMFSRSNIGQQGAQNGQENGMPRGLSATSTAQSRTLEDKINGWLARSGSVGRVRFGQISAVSLPDALNRALARFTDTTGTKVVLFRNYTPEVDDFNGVSFRDGTVYINETNQYPMPLVAVHEWVHQLKKDNPQLYQQLEDEVRHQGRLDKWHERNIKEEGFDRGRDHAIEELTAAAVSDALIDPAFLQKLAERKPGYFTRMARAFLDFLNTLTSGWKDQGSNAYLRDVEAFRDKLTAVLDLYEATTPAARAKIDKASFLRVWHGTPHRGIEKTGFKLNKIGTGEGAQAYGWGIYFADEREVSEAYRERLTGLHAHRGSEAINAAGVSAVVRTIIDNLQGGLRFCRCPQFSKQCAGARRRE